MAVERIVDCAGFELAPGVPAFVAAEGVSAGALSCSIVTDPAPYPDTESNCLRITQGAAALWTGRVYPFTAGDVYFYQGYHRFSRAAGLPNDNDIPFFKLHDGVNDHITYQLEGGTSDVEIIDAAGVVQDTTADVFPDLDRWYLVSVYTLLNNVGYTRLQAWDTVTGVRTIASVIVEDFYTGTDFVGVRLGGEINPPPAGPTTVYVGSYKLSESTVTIPFNDAKVTSRHYTIIGAQPTQAGNIPHCDASGNDPGSKDTLDGGEWLDAGSGTIGDFCTYTGRGDEGAVKIDYPSGDSRLNSEVVRLAGSWVYVVTSTASGNLHIVHGKGDSVYSVNEVNPAIAAANGPFHIVEDFNDGGNVLPDLDEFAVLGFTRTVAGFNFTRLVEAAYFELLEYPLRVRQVGKHVFAGGAGRIIV